MKYHRTRLGVTPRYLQDVERGAVGVSLTTLRNLCQALEVSADALLFDAPADVDSMLRGIDRERVEKIDIEYK